MLQKELRKAKIKALLIHLLISLGIFLIIAGILIFYLFPSFYFGLSGGFRGLEMMFAIDMFIGPLLTLIVYNPKKSMRETILDFSVIALVQLSALVYGFYTVQTQHPKLLMLYQEANGAALPAYTVDGVDSLKDLPAGTDFTIEGVKTVMLVQKATVQSDPLSFDVMDIIKTKDAEAQPAVIFGYENPLKYKKQLRKADAYFRKRLQNEGFADELKNREKNHENTWLLFIEGKYEGAYILLDENFKFIAKIGAKEI